MLRKIAKIIINSFIQIQEVTPRLAIAREISLNASFHFKRV